MRIVVEYDEMCRGDFGAKTPGRIAVFRRFAGHRQVRYSSTRWIAWRNSPHSVMAARPPKLGGVLTYRSPVSNRLGGKEFGITGKSTGCKSTGSVGPSFVPWAFELESRVAPHSNCQSPPRRGAAYQFPAPREHHSTVDVRRGFGGSGTGRTVSCQTLPTGRAGDEPPFSPERGSGRRGAIGVPDVLSSKRQRRVSYRLFG